MCEYCSKETEWVVFTIDKTNGLMVCTGHLVNAIHQKHSEGKSDEMVHSEPVYP